MLCRNCGSVEIKKRKNYSHGKSSGGHVILSCKKCRSSDVEVKTNYYRKRR